MKTIIFLVAMTVILGTTVAFAGEAGKMPYNGIIIFEESPAGSPVSESKTIYNGVTVFRTGPGDFENLNLTSTPAQFADCPFKQALTSLLVFLL